MINVKFEVIDLESQIDILKDFCFRDGNTAEYVAKCLGLEASSITKNFEKKIEKMYTKNLGAMKKKCLVFQKAWDGKKDFINKEFTKVFGRTFDFDCLARVNLNPIMPRFLKEKILDINFECDEDFSVMTTCHEIAHFAWFEVLAENFPEIPATQYETPHTPWLISEIAVEPIFRFSKLHTLSPKQPAYDYFYTDKIGEQTVTEIANSLFKKSKNIVDFQKNMLNFFDKEKSQDLIK